MEKQEEIKAVKELIKRKWAVDRVEVKDNTYLSIRIKAKYIINYYIWIDYNYKDRTWDFNQYIFDNTNSFDIIKERLQADSEFIEHVDYLLDSFVA